MEKHVSPMGRMFSCRFVLVHVMKQVVDVRMVFPKPLQASTMKGLPAQASAHHANVILQLLFRHMAFREVLILGVEWFRFLCRRWVMSRCICGALDQI